MSFLLKEDGNQREQPRPFPHRRAQVEVQQISALGSVEALALL